MVYMFTHWKKKKLSSRHTGLPTQLTFSAATIQFIFSANILVYLALKTGSYLNYFSFYLCTIYIVNICYNTGNNSAHLSNSSHVATLNLASRWVKKVKFLLSLY